VIEISFNAALGIYGGIVVLGALAIWIYTEITTVQSHKVLGKQNLWRCVYCSFSWLDDAFEPVSKCPRCGSLNHAADPVARPAGALPVETDRDEDEDDKPRRNPSRRKRPGARTRGPRSSR